MVAKIVVEGWHAFWEAPCPDCGRVVTESVRHASADCEECGGRVDVGLEAGIAVAKEGSAPVAIPLGPTVLHEKRPLNVSDDSTNDRGEQ